MSFVVKNTTKCGLLDLICPHTCRGCGQLGTALCERCKKNIVKKRKAICPLCKGMVAERGEKGGNMTLVQPVADSGVRNGEKRVLGGKIERCGVCDLPFEGLWVLGWREGALKKAVKDYKYKSVRALARELAELLSEILPAELGEGVIVVPLPTIGRHVRERGMDHTALLARELVRLRKKAGWKWERVLGRATDTVQVGAKVAERQRQAETTYIALRGLDAQKKYLLLDDVWTTGATMLAAERVLREAGAERIYGAVLATGKAQETGEGEKFANTNE